MRPRTDGDVAVVTFDQLRTPPHEPLRHAMPVAHAALVPHWQPKGPHESARELSQARHAAPAVPH